MSNNLKLANKVALITGGTAGIGLGALFNEIPLHAKPFGT
jgi:NADP-dependent 3-hydroxy acid dehydrogenase YdfG